MLSPMRLRALLLAPLCAIAGLAADAQESVERAPASAEDYEKSEAMRASPASTGASDPTVVTHEGASPTCGR